MTFLRFYKSFIKIFSFDQKREILILFFLSIFAMIFETLSIASIFPFLDYIFEGSKNIGDYKFLTNIIKPNSQNYLIYLIVFFIFVFFIKALYLSFFTYKKNKFIYDIRTFQTNNLFDSYINENYLFHINTNSANLIRNLNDANLLSVFARSLIDLFAEIVMFFGILIFLLILSPEITLGLTFFFGLLGLVFYKLVQTRASIWGEQSKIYRGLKLKNQKESFGAIRDIKILGKEKNFINIFSLNNHLENEYTKKHSFVLSLPKIWFEWLAVIAMVTLIMYLTQNLIDKSRIIPILGIFALAAYRLIPSISKISNYLQDMKFCLPAVEPFMENQKYLEEKFNKENSIIANKKITFNDKILIKDLSFKFPGTSNNILQNLDFQINKGECIGIYGRSGEGKTTLINLLLGLLIPNSGTVTVDNKNIGYNLKGWQKIISYIPQNVFITDEKIINNIALGEDENKIDYKKVEEITKISNIDDFISNLPNGLNTKCGELGERFSGGQKQRLGIARAFYVDAEILIFDEFTNFLDANNEEKIINEVNLLKGKKTIVMISHKISTLSKCDKIFKLENKNLTISK